MIFKNYKISNLSEILYVPYSECVYFKSGIGFWKFQAQSPNMDILD